MQIESFILLTVIVRILRTMKKPKIVAKHVYTNITRGLLLLNYVSIYSLFTGKLLINIKKNNFI